VTATEADRRSETHGHGDVESVALGAARGAWPALLTGLFFVALAVVSDSVWALAAGGASERLRGSRRFLAVQRYVSGSVFVGLGAVTALAKRY